MAKGKTPTVGGTKPQGSTTKITRRDAKQGNIRSLMAKGREMGRAAKSLAKEQITGTSMGKTARSRIFGGTSLVERARAERARRYNEAKERLAAKKDEDQEMMSDDGGEDNGGLKVKQEVLVEDNEHGKCVDEQEDMDVVEEEKEVPNVIRTDGEEFTPDGRPETDEEYKKRVEEENREINRQQSQYTEEEWEKVEIEAAKEELRRNEEAKKASKGGGNEVQSKGESSEEDKSVRATSSNTSEENEADDQSYDSTTGGGGGDRDKDEVEIMEVTGGQEDQEKNEQENYVEIMEVQKGDKEEESKEEDEKKESGNGNTQTMETGQEEINKEDEGAKVSFAGATKGMTQQYLGARVTYEKTCQFEISALIDRLPADATDDQQAAAVKDLIISLLKRFQHITKRVAIQPWYTDTLLPSIEKKEQISDDLNTLKDYITHEGSRNKKFRNGRNSKLLVKVTFDKVAGGAEEIQHLWQQQTRERKLQQLMPITLKVAVMQSVQYYLIGSFVNSSEKQIVKALAAGLSKKLNSQVSLAYRDVPAEYRTIEKFWVAAKTKAGGSIRDSYMYAPQALVVYSNERRGSVRVALIKELMKQYGKMTAKGEYPTLPDGSKMRFIPPETMAPASQRYKIRDSIKRQIDLRSVTTTIDKEYAFDIDKEVKEGPYAGKTLGELMLGLTSADIKYGGVPFFKHFVQKWAMDFRHRGVAVAVFTNMAPIATEIMGSLQGVMEKMYGPEVGREIKTYREGATLTAEGDLNSEMFQIQLEDDDWFDKTGMFVLTGIYNTKENQAKEGAAEEGLAPAIKLPSGVDVLMDTHSIISLNSIESNATRELAGGEDSNQGGIPAGSSRTGASGAAVIANHASNEQSNTNQQGASQNNGSATTIVNNNQDDKNEDCNSDTKHQGGGEGERDNNAEPQGDQVVIPIPVTPKRNERGVNQKHTSVSGRGRGGGRGRGHQSGRAGVAASTNLRPTIISPNGKTSTTAGGTGGSGPSMTTDNRTESESWIRSGTEEDEKKLREQIEQGSAGAAAAGEHP